MAKLNVYSEQISLRGPSLSDGQCDRGRIPLGQIVVAFGLVSMSIASIDPVVLLASMTMAALLSALTGNLPMQLFCFGLALSFGPARFSGVPYSAMVPLAILLGTLILAMSTRRALGGGVGLCVMVAALGAYWAFRPPTSNAGVIAAFAFTLVPACVLVLGWATAQATRRASALSWFAAGTTVSIGLGLIDAYQAIGGNYSQYEEVRLFTSAIGSSNYAAALAAVPAVLLVTLAVEGGGPRRWIVLACATPFLAAPVIFASRGALVAMTLGLVALTLHTQRGRPGLRVARILGLLVGTVGLATLAAEKGWLIYQRLATENTDTTYLSGREDLWKGTFELAMEHPLIGLGPGRLTDVLLRDSGFAYSHSIFLESIAQLGIVGGVLWLYLVRPQPLRVWSPVVPALIVIVVNSAVEPVISTPIGAILYAGLIGCHFAVTGGSILGPRRIGNPEDTS